MCFIRVLPCWDTLQGGVKKLIVFFLNYDDHHDTSNYIPIKEYIQLHIHVHTCIMHIICCVPHNFSIHMYTVQKRAYTHA